MTRPLIPPPWRPHVGRPRRRLLAALVAVLIGLTLSPAAVAAQQDLTEVSDRPIASFGGTANSANARFIVGGYQHLLNRTADEAGVDFHLARMTSGGERTRLAFTYSLLFSAEGASQEVDRVYDQLLDRDPDAVGAQFWQAHLQGHDVLDLRVLVLSSDEYYSRAGGNDGAWLTALYRDVLGRDPDADGFAYWQARVATAPRPMIVAGLYLSDEALGRRVEAYYNEAVGRTPSEAEKTAGVARIRSVGERHYRAIVWASDDAFEPYLDAALS